MKKKTDENNKLNSQDAYYYYKTCTKEVNSRLTAKEEKDREISNKNFIRQMEMYNN